jgi:sulfatase maturation enzyme AslB (radical SAM superfamily)
MPSTEDFYKLHNLKRIKFLDIEGSYFIFNTQQSTITQKANLPREYLPFVVKAVIPPVKTLILHATYNCNLSCIHCYLNAGKPSSWEMDSNELTRIVKEFGDMGGLQVDISGGEPLLKEGIEEVIYASRDKRLRTFVLSNAIDLDSSLLNRIRNHIDGMAIGLDGLYDVNDKIRGHGSFTKILKGLDLISKLGVELSITTLISEASIPQLLDFPNIINKYGATSWSLVMPRPSGRFITQGRKIMNSYAKWEFYKKNGLLGKLYDETSKRNIKVILDHILVPASKRNLDKKMRDIAYEIYNKGRACWDNTLTVMPNGDLKCCLFFDDQIYDNVLHKSLKETYLSSPRKEAIKRFKKFPSDQCPYLAG